MYPILNRSAFESRLGGWLEAPTHCDDAWCALLNAVLALGSRAMLSAGTSTAFEHSAQEGWDYFRNAVDLEMNLVHEGTSLTAIQVCHHYTPDIRPRLMADMVSGTRRYGTLPL